MNNQQKTGTSDRSYMYINPVLEGFSQKAVVELIKIIARKVETCVDDMNSSTIN